VNAAPSFPADFLWMAGRHDEPHTAGCGLALTVVLCSLD